MNSTPDDADRLHLLGIVLGQTGRPAEAATMIRRSLELRPGHGEAWRNLGVALAAGGDTGAAISAYRRAVACGDGLPALLGLAVLLAKARNFEEAIAVFRRAIDLKPDCAEACAGLGAALAENGQYDPAVAALRQAIELKPGDAGAQANLGLALRQLGRLTEAIETLCAAIALKSDFAPAYQALGATLRQARAAHRAIPILRRAL
ncbi:MAG: tetratricopeptide repeat protein [Phycisphaerae bacterium]|nr:tetratricopeptide repeat protein [Phycisphaerae bacterium]